MSEGVYMRRPIRKIAFFGDANVKEESETYKLAYEAAKLVAEAGYVIVNGGGPGVMNASTQGAESVNGETISVSFSPKNAPGFKGKYVWNVTDKSIETENYVERMFKLMEVADLFLIFKGGTGTISELGTAWVLAKLYFGHHKPFILVGRHWRPIMKAFEENMLLDEQELEVFRIVDKLDQVLPKIEELREEMKSFDHSDCEICQVG